jgi:hypothetical protein
LKSAVFAAPPLETQNDIGAGVFLAIDLKTAVGARFRLRRLLWGAIAGLPKRDRGIGEWSASRLDLSLDPNCSRHCDAGAAEHAERQRDGEHLRFTHRYVRFGPEADIPLAIATHRQTNRLCPSISQGHG